MRYKRDRECDCDRDRECDHDGERIRQAIKEAYWRGFKDGCRKFSRRDSDREDFEENEEYEENQEYQEYEECEGYEE